MIFSINILPVFDDFLANKKLAKYDVIINNIEEYKMQSGVYPQEIEDNVKVFSRFYYNTKNEEKDFILTVSDNYLVQFNYCSSEDLYGCYPQQTHYGLYEKRGKWIKFTEYD